MIPEEEEVEAIPDGGTRSGTAKGAVACLRAATGSGVDTPPTLFERRSTISQATMSPAGSASPYVVAGHSGADHPPGADEIGPGVSFGEAPDTHEPRMWEQGCEGVLSTPIVPSTLRSPGSTSLRSKSPGLVIREHHEDGETSTGASDSRYSEGIRAPIPVTQEELERVDAVTGSPSQEDE